MDADHRGRRLTGPVVPAPVRLLAAGPQLGQPRGGGRRSRDPALLARPRRRRLPRRRRARPRQGHDLPRHRRPREPDPRDAHGPRRRLAGGDGPSRPRRQLRGARSRRGAGHLPRLAPGHGRVRPRRDGRGRGLGARRSVRPATSRPTRCTRSSTSTSWPARGMPAACGPSSRRPWTSLTITGAPATWALSNHDSPRVPTRLGGGDEGRRRARALALVAHALPGAVYVYQGEELGLADVDLPDEVRQDPVFFRTNGEQKGRDAARVPIPWSGDATPVRVRRDRGHVAAHAGRLGGRHRRGRGDRPRQHPVAVPVDAAPAP